MEKIATVARKNNSAKSPAPRKYATPPFADKIPFIRSLILDSVKPGTIKKIYLFGSYAYGNRQKKAILTCALLLEIIF